jgi:hypothetical protein
VAIFCPKCIAYDIAVGFGNFTARLLGLFGAILRWLLPYDWSFSKELGLVVVIDLELREEDLVLVAGDSSA